MILTNDKLELKFRADYKVHAYLCYILLPTYREIVVQVLNTQIRYVSCLNYDNPFFHKTYFLKAYNLQILFPKL